MILRCLLQNFVKLKRFYTKFNAFPSMLMQYGIIIYFDSYSTYRVKILIFSKKYYSKLLIKILSVFSLVDFNQLWQLYESGF